MIKQADSHSSRTSMALKYFSLVIIGVLIILLCSLIQHVPAPARGEYYFSLFFMKNFTLLAKIMFFIAGFLAGYLYRLNPWYSGLCLNLIFPLTSIIEATIYKGSHNLLPIEFAFHLWFALPSVIAVYIGRFISKIIAKRKGKVEGKVTN